MGFFSLGQKVKASPTGNVSIELLHRMECKACPLSNAACKTPNMPPHGAKWPLIYMLGEAPGKDEDERGRPFVGKAGRVLRMRLPDWADDDVLRWSNCIRTRPPNNRTPTPVEIECCRPSIVRDIEAAEPDAIFGFGAVPLQWALGQASRITAWCGRRLPIKVGEHACWFYPMLHPSFIARTRRYEPRGREYGSGIELGFAFDLQRAFSEVEAGLPVSVVHDAERALANIQTINGENGEADLERIHANLAMCRAEGVAGFDYETNRLRPYHEDARILTAAVSHISKATAFAVDSGHWSKHERKGVHDMLADFLYDKRVTKLVHNLAFELEWSAFFFGNDVVRAGGWEDSASQAYILDERMNMTKPDCHSLEFLGLQYFGVNLKAINNLDRNALESAPIDDVLQYNALDAKYHRLLFHAQHKRLKAEGLLALYYQHLERVPTAVLTQLKGVPVDQAEVEKFDGEYTKELRKLERLIEALPAADKYRRLIGKPYRPSAPQDALVMLRQVLGRQVEKADEPALRNIGDEIIQLTLEWRSVNKLHSTYVLPVRADSEHVFPDGLLHPILSTIRTRTWRTSSDSPNVQNFPIRKHREIRRMVRKRKRKIVAFDYAGIQARNVAMESLDKKLIKAFWENYDIHTDWKERTLRLYPKWQVEDLAPLRKGDEKLHKAYRNKAKNGLVFPFFFGAQPRKVASVMQIPEHVAEQLQDDFWHEFPDVKGWHERIMAFYKQNGYVTGLTGFRRRAPISPNELINAPIQADESAIVLDAMTRLSKLDHDKLQANMEIHDDLTFVWAEDEIDELAEVVVREMLACPFKWAKVVPLQVEMSVGDDWEQKKEVGVYVSTKGGGYAELGKESGGTHAGSWQDGTGWAAVEKNKRAK